jgi:hypothetical protein
MARKILYFSEYYNNSGQKIKSIETEFPPIHLIPGDEIIIEGKTYVICRVLREHRDGPNDLFLNLIKYQLKDTI